MCVCVCVCDQTRTLFACVCVCAGKDSIKKFKELQVEKQALLKQIQQMQTQALRRQWELQEIAEQRPEVCLCV